MTEEVFTKVETQTCGRCGGTGHYSFNYIDGSRCYGCGGSGVKLTKRGAVVNKVLTDSRQIDFKLVKAGMIIDYDIITMGGKSGRMVMFVESIKHDVPMGRSRSNESEEWVDNYGTEVTLVSKNGHVEKGLIGYGIKTKFRVTPETMIARREFIGTATPLLTKTGTVRKGKVDEWDAAVASLISNTEPAMFETHEAWVEVINRKAS